MRDRRQLAPWCPASRMSSIGGRRKSLYQSGRGITGMSSVLQKLSKSSGTLRLAGLNGGEDFDAAHRM